MIYLSYSFQFLSFAAGMVSLFIAIQLFNQYKFKYLKANILLTTGYILIMLFNSIGSILDIEQGTNDNIHSFGVYDQILFFVVPVMLIFILYQFRLVLFGLINKKIEIKFAKFLWILLISFIVVQSILTIFIKVFPFYIQVLPMLIVQIIFYSQIFRILFCYKKGINEKKSEIGFVWLKYIYNSEISYFVFLLIIVFVNLIGVIGLNLFTAISSFAAMIINPVLIFLFVKYHQQRYSIADNNFEQLIIQYDITEREKEIIISVCKGKTNKEIADVLFLSPLTVRDHLSNIYRKTNVNNRTKLAGIFK